MNLNLTAYLIYFLFTILIIVKVGKICYQNGNIFMAQLIPKHQDLGQKVNQILLLGYYLLNIGYCAITIISWEQIRSVTQLLEIITSKSALIIIIIGILHYCNIFIITNYIKKII